MYNALKNKMDTYFFNRHISGSYDKISEVENEEEVYCHKNKLAVVVKDEEVGKRIYNIVKTLKQKETTIETLNAKIRITKYISDRENTVSVFYMNFTLKNEFWEDLDDIQKLKELVSFVNAVKENGYIIDKSIYDYKKCDQIAALLSFFKPIEGEEEDENECIIEYIHYILSKGKDLNEFYSDIEKQGLVATIIFPYGSYAMQMFYQYYKLKKFKEEILTFLDLEERESKYSSFGRLNNGFFQHIDYLLFDEKNLENNCQSYVDRHSKYTIYRSNKFTGNIKIYHDINFERFSEFFQKVVYPLNERIIENIEEKIYDLNFNVVGHKFYSGDDLSKKQIKFRKNDSQSKLVKFMKEMLRFCNSVNEFSFNNNMKPLGENEFELEKALLYDFSYDSERFYFIELIDLYNFTSCSEEQIKIQITEIFFKLFLKFLKENFHDDFINEEQFFKINEVRYLNPILVREFINYSLGKAVNYITAIEEIERLLLGRQNVSGLGSKLFYYDSRFIYDPARVSYLFDYEVKGEYGIEIKDEELGKTFTLPDGKRIVTFPTNMKTVACVEYAESTLRKEIWNKFNNFYGDVNLVGINQIIYKKSIENGFYEFVGYVTDSIKGNKLTDDFLVSLSNKDFLRVAAELFTKFDSECIPLETIYMDENYNFYIDIHDKKCLIKRSPCRGSRFRESTTYIYWIINELTAHPNCNMNTFIDFKKDNYAKRSTPSRSLLMRLAVSYDTYCEEHGIYFDSVDKMCPICHETKYFVDYHGLGNVIFEDKYARHYRIDSNFNFKEYKKTKVDVTAMEEKVTEIMSEIDIDPAAPIKKYHQECFMPYKKAINSHNKFIGYVYKAVDFDRKNGDGSCISLKDLKNMSNLPRIKSLIRLILQTKEIVSEGKGFIKNPFDDVFLIKGYAKQVQFVNIEFITNQVNSEEIFNWAYQYIFDAVNADKDIELNLLDCQNVDIALRELTDLSKKLTKYCSLHNMYYEERFLFCPKCIPESEVKDAEVIPVEPSAIFALKQINEGGESFIYDYDGNSVVKVFKETEINVNLKNKIIAKLLTKKELLNDINNENKINGIKYRYIIPDKLFLDKNSNNVFAYLMEKVENAKPISTLRDKSQVEALGLTKQDVFEILITIGEGIETLHKRAGIYIGDLNGRNILFDTQKNVYFLDFDGMGIDEIAPEFCTDGYIDPISKKKNKITMKDDWYSYAIQAFYYLTYTHPFNGVYYVEDEDGSRVALEITDKMERRISLLGNHGMDAPAVAEPWHWMITSLEVAFLRIFEGNNRDSIVPLLKKQYGRLYGNIPEPKKVKAKIRVNSKFVATKLPIFNGEVTNVINHFSAVYKDEAGEYRLTILGKEGKTLIDVNLFEYYKNIIDVILSDDEKFAFVIFDDTVVILDIEGSTQLCTKKISDPNNVVVNGSTLYFNLDNIIHELTFESRKLVKEHKIKFLTEYEMKKFYVRDNSKFVQIKRNTSEKADKIYCNSELLCNVNYDSEATEYNIVYDEITKFWLVVNSEGNVVCINANNGSYEQVNIPNIDDFNMDNLTFYNGNIYIPDEDCLYIVSVNNQFATKKMECHSIMTPDSKVCSVNNDGFNVIANNSIYEVRRG